MVADTGVPPGGRSFAVRVTRWAIGVRLAFVLVAVLVPVADVDTAGRLAVALLGLWSLLWIEPSGRVLALVQAHPAVATLDCLLVIAVTGALGVDSPVVFAMLSSALVIGVLFRPMVALLVTLVLLNGHLLVAAVDPPTRGAGFLSLFVLPGTYVALAVLGSVVRGLQEQVLREHAEVAHARIDEAASTSRSSSTSRDE